MKMNCTKLIINRNSANSQLGLILFFTIVLIRYLIAFNLARRNYRHAKVDNCSSGVVPSTDNFAVLRFTIFHEAAFSAFVLSYICVTVSNAGLLHVRSCSRHMREAFSFLIIICAGSFELIHCTQFLSSGIVQGSLLSYHRLILTNHCSGN